MKKNLFFVLILLVLMLTMPVKNKTCFAAAETGNLNIISVTGSASLYTAPDEVVLFCGVRTTNASPAKASSENAVIMKNVYNVLNNFDIPKTDIITVSYNIYPNYNYSDASKLTGYSVQHDLKIKIESVDSAGKLIDALTKAGVSNINSLQFSKGNSRDEYKHALVNALKDATEKAELIAASLNKEVRLIKVIEENSHYGIYRESFVKFDAAASAGTSFASGQIDITANVKCEFELN